MITGFIPKIDKIFWQLKIDQFSIQGILKEKEVQKTSKVKEGQLEINIYRTPNIFYQKKNREMQGPGTFTHSYNMSLKTYITY